MGEFAKTLASFREFFMAGLLVKFALVETSGAPNPEHNCLTTG
jgi:hypothetical protein